jgi:heptose-I-phosphate ethanolaminephosphotransferase
MKAPSNLLIREACLALLSLLLGLFLLSSLIGHSKDQWRPFDSTYISYDSRSGHNIQHFAIRSTGNRYLLAGDTPSDLKLSFNFLDSSIIRVKVVSQYPDWKCKSDSVGKASIRFSGKNIEKKFRLEDRGVAEFIFKAFRAQGVRVSIANRAQKDCGRADVYFEVSANNTPLLASFFAFWFAVSMIFILVRQQQVFMLTGLAILLASISVTTAYSALTLSSLFWLNGFAASIMGLLLVLRAIPLRWLRNLSWFGVVMACVIFYGSFIGYELSVGEALNDDAVHALMQTNMSEAFGFLDANSGLAILFVLLSVALLLVWLLAFLDTRKQIKQGAFLGLLLFSLGLSLALNKSFSPPFIMAMERAVSSYLFEIETYAALQDRRRAGKPLSKSTQVQLKSQTMIVVIGESANRDHLGLYGYGRNTTPYSELLLDKGEMLRFDLAYSNHTHTNPSLALALTSADQYLGQPWMKSASILNIANDAGIETHWISNQQMLGAWDNHVSLIAREATHFISKNKLTGTARDAKEHDGVLLESIEDALRNSSVPTKLIFVHLQGSHASYCSRFPKSEAHYVGIRATKNIFGSLANHIARSNNGVLNCYDSSIQYTDLVLSRITTALAGSDNPAALLYISDHSEDIINNKAHNSSLFTFDMAEIPLLFWSNKQWRKSYQALWSGLAGNTKKLFTSDHLFETIAGLLGINSLEINIANDLSSNSYLEQDQPTTLHGRKRIKSVENFSYWQRNNISSLPKDECSKLLPHRVNTIGKAREAISSGLCGIEIDVLIEKNQDETVFQVGHDDKTRASMTLEDFFDQIQMSEIEKIWLDVKNVNQSLIPGMMERLEHLDKKFDLKQRTLIETSFYADGAAEIARNGYKLSYYLPTGKVLKVMQAEQSTQTELAITIAKRVDEMEADNISFDLRLYPFVKSKLEAELRSRNVAYHSWFPSELTFYSPRLLPEISQRPYFYDPKMQTILLTFASQFSL